jgi:hypothetical protein
VSDFAAFFEEGDIRVFSVSVQAEFSRCGVSTYFPDAVTTDECYVCPNGDANDVEDVACGKDSVDFRLTGI